MYYYSHFIVKVIWAQRSLGNFLRVSQSYSYETRWILNLCFKLILSLGVCLPEFMSYITFIKLVWSPKVCFIHLCFFFCLAYRVIEGGMIWENSTETYILSNVKQIASPSWMHETSAQGWYTGMTQRDGMGMEVRGGFRMGNTCK